MAATKSVNYVPEPEESPMLEKKGRLKKELGLISSVGLIFGNVIGSGIFITTSSILSYTQSFGLTLVVWVVGGLIAMIGAFCYCELGTMIKKSGSEYAYILEAYSFGKRKGYKRLIGSALAFSNVWYDFMVGNPSSLAIPLLTFGKYMCRPFFLGCAELPALPVKLFALAGLIISTLVNIYSVKWASRVSTVLSFLKFISLAFVVILGIYHIAKFGCFSTDAVDPFAHSSHDISSIALGLYGVMYAYDGWDALNMMQEEAKDIERVLPRATLIAIPLVILSYVVVNVSFFSVLSYSQIQSAEAVGLVFGNAVLGQAGLVIIPFLVVLSTFSSAHVSLLSQSRKLFVSSRDGLLPDFIGSISVTYCTPIPAILCISILAAILICIGTIDQIINAFVATVWFYYGLAIFGIFILRLVNPERRRPFKVWLILPSFMIIAIGFLVIVPLIQNALAQVIAFGITFLGIPVYFLFVMENPWKVRPKIMDRLAERCAVFINQLMGTTSSR